MTTTRQTRKANAKAIVEYSLTTIGLNATIVKIVIDTLKLDTLDRLLEVTQNQILTAEGIGVGDAIDIARFQRYMKEYTKDDTNQLPDSPDTWKAIFTEDYYEQELQKLPKSVGETPNKIRVTTSKKPTHVSIKIGDYLTYSGRHDEWYNFRAKCSALARIHGYTDVLEITDENEHLQKHGIRYTCTRYVLNSTIKDC